MKNVRSVVEFFSEDELVIDIGEAILKEDDPMRPNFLATLNSTIKSAADSADFESYKSVAQCHGLIVASFPKSCDYWVRNVVLDDFAIICDQLNEEKRIALGLTAYEVGTLLGIFQVGVWMQKHKQRLLHRDFLPAIADYCVASLDVQRPAPNIFVAEDEVLQDAERKLDRAVKEYLRPSNPHLAAQLNTELKLVLKTLNGDLLISPRQKKHSTLCGPGLWLVNAFTHGILDVRHRTSQELIPAAVALI